MGFGSTEWRLAHTLPGVPASTGLAGIIGAVSAMMGIGGGTLSVPVLTLFGVPVHRAVGTAAGFGLLISVPATIGFAIGGWNAAGLPAVQPGLRQLGGPGPDRADHPADGPGGGAARHGLSQKGLRRAFAIFLGLTAVRMLGDVIRF